MGSQYNSGRVTADISGIVAMGYTSSSITGLSQVARSTAGSTTYTVPVGKIAIVVSAFASEGVASSVSLVRGGVTIYLAESDGGGTIGMSWTGQQVMSAGEVLTISGRGSAQYYEITA